MFAWWVKSELFHVEHFQTRRVAAKQLRTVKPHRAPSRGLISRARRSQPLRLRKDHQLAGPVGDQFVGLGLSNVRLIQRRTWNRATEPEHAPARRQDRPDSLPYRGVGSDSPHADDVRGISFPATGDLLESAGPDLNACEAEFSDNFSEKGGLPGLRFNKDELQLRNDDFQRDRSRPATRADVYREALRGADETGGDDRLNE